jgi:hypothetical protein
MTKANSEDNFYDKITRFSESHFLAILTGSIVSIIVVSLLLILLNVV